MSSCSQFMLQGCALSEALEASNPILVMLLSDSPVVPMIFREFIDDCLNMQPLITDEVACEAVRIFLESLDRPESWKHPLPRSYKSFWGVELHIAHFMLRVLDRVKFGNDGLRRRFDEDPDRGAQYIFGMLGVCIRLYQDGKFPDGPANLDAHMQKQTLSWIASVQGNLDHWYVIYEQAIDQDGERDGDDSDVSWHSMFLSLIENRHESPDCPSFVGEFEKLDVSECDDAGLRHLETGEVILDTIIVR
ncbi:Uu.00g108150.m01.CDS01 [Anthostomella pinea]|uniref:Uu.00g108150.m01.CDS01 n=1 Tax=Anthostomella pinea TaxID=933095 RepID=A0AAI8VEG9_9PEZI|nr:Uu.00g108150.m01.CDS01 [Anthostomella pinea]